MIKLATVIYICILVAVLSIGMLVGSSLGGGSASGTVVPIHGHMNEQLYEVVVPDGLVGMFIGEEGHFSCDTPDLCHIQLDYEGIVWPWGDFNSHTSACTMPA